MRPRRRGRAISKKVVACMSDLDESELECMASEVQYHPSEFHKTLEALQRWNLSSPGRRRGKMACPDTGPVSSRKRVVRLLKEAIRRGMVSRARRDSWPNRVWAIGPDDGVYEAKLTKAGLYHAFPLRGPSAFVRHLRIEWSERNV